MDNKYNAYSNYKLKSCLKQLKNSGADIVEIRYVSHLLRSRLIKSRPANSDRNDDEKIRVNFWGYVKNIFKKSAVKLLSFDVSTCTDFFSKFFSSLNTTKNFQIPDWIPSLPLPISPFDLSPPSYKQIMKVVRRIKASVSPCPLDQLSIIPFKRCLYLRSYLTEVFRTVWQSGEIPNEWKNACTMLIHKKGDQSDPANFRPITLESTPLKIFTSCLRDSMFAFLSANGYIEHCIQKGFMPKLSGTYEHTAQMSQIINKARIKQRSVVITLLDLRNAFGDRVAKWPGTEDAKFFLRSCQKLPNRSFLTMTSQNSHACVLRPDVSYSCPRIKVGSVDRDIKTSFFYCQIKHIF